MRYDNVISLAVSIDSNEADLSDLSRDQLIAAFSSRINDIFDHDDFEEAVSLEDQIENTTYTIWFQDGEGDQEFLTEQQMRKESERYSFDAEDVVQFGEVFFWRIGVKPYANPSYLDYNHISGGCFKVEGGAS